MSDWNSNQYMKFGAERTQPSIDLVNRIADINPNRILDIGCGPGNSTDRLAKQFPNADILGVDFSEDMLKKHGQPTPSLDLSRALYPMISISLTGNLTLFFQMLVFIGFRIMSRCSLRFSISSATAVLLPFRFHTFKRLRFTDF